MPRAPDCVCSKLPEDERNTLEYTENIVGDNKGHINEKNINQGRVQKPQSQEVSGFVLNKKGDQKNVGR